MFIVWTITSRVSGSDFTAFTYAVPVGMKTTGLANPDSQVTIKMVLVLHNAVGTLTHCRGTNVGLLFDAFSAI